MFNFLTWSSQQSSQICSSCTDFPALRRGRNTTTLVTQPGTAISTLMRNINGSSGIWTLSQDLLSMDLLAQKADLQGSQPKEKFFLKDPKPRYFHHNLFKLFFLLGCCYYTPFPVPHQRCVKNEQQNWKCPGAGVQICAGKKRFRRRTDQRGELRENGNTDKAEFLWGRNDCSQ